MKLSKENYLNLSATFSNQTEVATTAEEEHSTLQIIQILCYSVIIIIGLFGNILIFLSVVCRKKRKISDYFILNLTITDLLCCVVSIPFDITELVYGYWPLGLLMCKIVYPLQTVLTAVSVVTLLFMALERHRVILYPLKTKIRLRYVVVTIVLLWVTAFALVTPYMSILELRGLKCIENWSGEQYVKAYTMCVFVLLYVAPLSTIIAVFIRVVFHLRNNSYTITRAFGNSMIGAQMRKTRSRRNTRVLKIFVSAVIAFALCNLPFHIMWLWNDFGNASDNNNFDDLLTFANIMVYTNSAVNPFIFGALSKRFRRFVHKVTTRKRSTNTSVVYVNGSNSPSLKTIIMESFHLKQRSRETKEVLKVIHNRSSQTNMVYHPVQMITTL